MKKTFLAAALFSFFTLQFAVTQAQNDPVVMEVGGQKIHQSEFMQEFYNNVGQQLAKNPDVTYAEKRNALDEYVELYSIFRAKLLDAHNRGFDTAASLQNELMRYRKELAAPYLIDSSVLRHLLDEAYERNHYSLHAAHILVQVRPGATPDDTLKAYQNAMRLYKRIVEDGEDFFDVSVDHVRTHNVAANVRPNEGDLGYFSVFDMIYPFENAAYGLKVGEVSKPVRTRFGYHLIKLLDRVEGFYGKLTMAHIWLHSTDSSLRRTEIDTIYQRLQKGAPFEMMARQSDDRTTAGTGGVLADATLTQLPPEYIHQLVGMKEGEYSKPFFTQYGWHIIKLIKRDSLPPAESLEGFYKQRMSRDQRGEESRKSFAADSRRRYGIVDCTVTPQPQPKKKKKQEVRMMASLDELMRVVADSVRHGKWVLDESLCTDTTALVITPVCRYTTLDVARFVEKHQRPGILEGKHDHMSRLYADFLDSVSIAYADSQLEKEYPEFAKIVDEYRRGLMIFNYNDAMIWHKALEDSVGFVAYYDRTSRTKSLSNPDDSMFFYHPRARLTIIDVADDAALDAAKAQKIIVKAKSKNSSSTAMKQLLLKKINRKNYPDDDIVKVDVEQIEQTRHKVLFDNEWQEGVYLHDKGNGYRLIVVEEVLPRSIKLLKDARGYYLNGWQNEVESQLNNELRQKYNVKIHRDAVRSITF